MSDRMVSCVRLFAFRKDISMNNKDRKRQIAYEVLMILGSLALLTFICRLWPILLLIILGIFVAAIRLLFLSGNRVDPVEPQPLLPAPHTGADGKRSAEAGAFPHYQPDYDARAE